jgi:hypothetical protein
MLVATIASCCTLGIAEAQNRIDVPGRMGGHVSDHVQQYRDLAQQGYELRIPPWRVPLGLHHGTWPAEEPDLRVSRREARFHEARNPRQTQVMWASYPSELRSLIESRGGLPPFESWLWLGAADMWAIGFRRC